MNNNFEWLYLPKFLRYDSALAIMQERTQGVIDMKMPETILMIEHPDIYTYGTGIGSEMDDNLRVAKFINGIELIKTGRGGKCTYHGPGQRIIWPIINLGLENRKRDIRLYVQMIGQWISSTLQKTGLDAYMVSQQDRLGVWVGEGRNARKIASIGIRMKKWVASYGVAVNINTDLTKFKSIVPCGIENVEITSLKAENISINMEEFDYILKQEFQTFIKMIYNS